MESLCICMVLKNRHNLKNPQNCLMTKAVKGNLKHLGCILDYATVFVLPEVNHLFGFSLSIFKNWHEINDFIFPSFFLK